MYYRGRVGTRRDEDSSESDSDMSYISDASSREAFSCHTCGGIDFACGRNRKVPAGVHIDISKAKEDYKKQQRDAARRGHTAPYGEFAEK